MSSRVFSEFQAYQPRFVQHHQQNPICEMNKRECFIFIQQYYSFRNISLEFQ